MKITTSQLARRDFFFQKQFWLRLGILVPVLFLTTGCGKDSMDVVPVSGTIHYEGKPVDRGRITFEPITLEREGAPLRPSMSPIKEDGTFTLSTFNRGDGVQPGKYKVIIWSVEKEPSDEDWAKMGTSFFLEWLIPEKYGRSDTTPLTQTIPADEGPLELTFELTDEDEADAGS